MSEAGKGSTGPVVLVAGESLMDMIPEPAADGSGTGEVWVPVPGGSPFNVALALGRLAVPVGFLGRFSRDSFGNRLYGSLEAAGVDLSYSRRTEALTMLGFIDRDAASGDACYAFYTEGTAGAALGVEDVPAPAPASVRAVHLGSFSVGLESFDQSLDAMIGACHRAGGVVSFDPNIRPFLVDDDDRYRARLNRIFRSAQLVKASDEDLKWLEPGSERNPEDWCARLAGAGAKGLAVVTLGDGGAVACSAGGGSARVAASQVDCVDTVGAGDTFQAAVLDWLIRNHSLDAGSIGGLDDDGMRELLTFASRAAAVTCSRRGCDPPWRDELD